MRTMSVHLHQAFDRECRLAQERRQEGQLVAAFAHLERAHILSQRHPWPHFKTHWLMWLIAFRGRRWPDLLGQPPRMLAALIFSRLWVPIGNTGGANVSAFRPMPVPADLAQLLRE